MDSDIDGEVKVVAGQVDCDDCDKTVIQNKNRIPRVWKSKLKNSACPPNHKTHDK